MPSFSLPTISRCQTAFLWLLPALLLFSRALADMAIISVGLLFLWRSYNRRDWAWLKYGWFRLALVFWFYLLLLNLPLSDDPQQTLTKAIGFIRWPVFAAALAYWLLVTKDQQRTLLHALVLTSLFVVLDTGWQYLFDVDWFGIERFTAERLTGPFRGPVPGTLMLRLWFVMLFAVFFWRCIRNQSYRLVSGVPLIILIALIFTFLTGERMALLLLSMGAIVVMTTLVYESQQYRRQLFIYFSGIGLVTISVMFAAPEMTERSVLSIAEKLSDFTSSDYGQVFTAAWQVWQAHFWLGTGLDTYQQVCGHMDVLAASAMSCTHPHNLYLELGAETGLFGLFLFVCMLAAVYHAALKAPLAAKAWLHASLSFSVLTVSFWPLSGGISLLSNWVGALVWLGVGWVLAVSVTPLQVRSQQTADPTD